MGTRSLRRYTNLAAAIHLLRQRTLTLLSPDSWDDRGDAYFLAQYKKHVEAKSVLALCFAEAKETYHHWRVFSHGPDGVCVEFDKSTLLSAFAMDPSIVSRSVKYLEINALATANARLEDLPFLKRVPYIDESEFRAVYTSNIDVVQSKDVPVPLDCILRITISPWLPEALAESVKQTLRSIDGCGNMAVYRSTLVENERWKGFAASIAD